MAYVAQYEMVDTATVQKEMEMNRREFLRGGILGMLGVAGWEGVKAILPEPLNRQQVLSLDQENLSEELIDLVISNDETECYLFASIEDIPLYDVPCPCGNPRHWLVKCVTTVKGLPQP